MVLGLRSKNRKGISVQVEYTIHVQEIKPWPPSQSLKSLRSVVLQWENGDQNSGSGSHVIPSLLEGRIVFNESFKLNATLQKEAPSKGTDGGTFQKNILDLNLYEIRREKAGRGQHIGGAAVDLAEHGVIHEPVSISVPVTCKRSFRNSSQPVLFLTIQPFKNVESGSSSSAGSVTEGSSAIDADSSPPLTIHGEVAAEEEIASFTEDESSMPPSAPAKDHDQSSMPPSAPAKDHDQSPMPPSAPAKDHDQSPMPPSAPAKDHDQSSHIEHSGAEPSPSTTTQSNSDAPLMDVSESTDPEKNTVTCDVSKREDVETITEERETNEEHCEIVENIPQRSDEDDDRIKSGGMISNEVEENSRRIEDEVIISHGGGAIEEITLGNEEREVIESNQNDSVEIRCLNDDPSTESQQTDSPQSQQVMSPESQQVMSSESQQADSPQSQQVMSPESQQADSPQSQQVMSPESQHAGFPQSQQVASPQSQQVVQSQRSVSPQSQRAESPPSQRAESPPSQRAVIPQSVENGNQRLLKSVRSPSLTARNDNFLEDVKEIDVLEKPRKRESSFSYRGKVSELESKVKLLEAELREAAAVEIGLYSVVAEHGSSAQKVNAPARRLLRLYSGAPDGTGGVARTAISGLVLVAKACGNDVPRLTFWLSNTVVLRAAVAKRVDPSDISESNGKSPVSSPLRWKSLTKGEKHLSSLDDLDDWEDPHTFISALEKIEAWIFSRVVESLWWQTLTPHMQSPGKIDGRRKDLNQMTFSMDLWKKAFKDASERLCPVRAGGHQCGCLPMLPKLIMEQCVARLDVAMFNAILRESGDDIPTDPVSDPITDPWVLPIPAGKSSFGSGAQLKNAIGNWCRGLTHWFSIDDEEEERMKPFPLLNALSDLLMLPKDMLLEKSIRKEVCPIFAAPILKRILSSFEPDEFCPDAVPKELMDTLDLEDEELLDSSEDILRNFPCAATRVVYSPPDVAAVADIIGYSCRHGSTLSKSSSTVLRKSNTSDDELDELDSSLNLVNVERSYSLTPPLLYSGAGLIRYQLLREVWRRDD